MSRIWKAPAEGGEAVARTSSDSDQPQASPDGKFLYYTSGWYGQWNDVWRIPTGAGEPTKVVERALGFEGPYAVVG